MECLHTKTDLNNCKLDNNDEFQLNSSQYTNTSFGDLSEDNLDKYLYDHFSKINQKDLDDTNTTIKSEHIDEIINKSINTEELEEYEGTYSDISDIDISIDSNKEDKDIQDINYFKNIELDNIPLNNANFIETNNILMLKETKTKKLPAWSNSKTPSVYNKEWMKNIKDYSLLSELSIPGSHESCSRHGLVFVQCQAWSIEDQLKAGIRFFDIRCRIIKDYLVIHHGFVYQFISFQEVLDQMISFLNSHPSEGIIMRIREEYKAKNPKLNFEDLFMKYVSKSKKYFHLSKEIPSMRKIRKKIWVIKCDSYMSWGTKSWSTLRVQDDYNLGIYTTIDKKIDKIRFQMMRANQDTNKEYNLYANHTSAFGVLCQEPIFVAKKTNSVVFEADKKNYKKIGITIMDFPGEGAIKCIIDLNFKK